METLMTAPRDDGVKVEQQFVGRLFTQLPGDRVHAVLAFLNHRRIPPRERREG
jgi:hypothetical protein